MRHDAIASGAGAAVARATEQAARVRPGLRVHPPPSGLVAGRYVAAVGGAATFGRGGSAGLSAALAGRLGGQHVNLGSPHAGPQAIMRDALVLPLAVSAGVCVLEACGVATQTNPFYRVHPRRGDRFIAAEPALKRLFPDVDFADIAFVGHLLATLETCDPARFARVRAGLRALWAERMAALLAALPRRTVLWWDAGAAPGAMTVDADLVAPLLGGAAAVVAVSAPGPDGPSDPCRRIAEALDPVLAPMVAGLVPG